MNQDGDIYAVFKMREWVRDLSPVEIFYDIKVAEIFIKNNLEKIRSEFSEVSELKIYRRSKTDWVIV